MHLMDRIAALIARRTPDLLRAEAMGFVFGVPEVIDHHLGFAVVGEFTCVCGRQERYLWIIEASADLLALDEMCDVGRQLRDHGAFSRKHLEQDGYSEQQIEEILARGAAFDLGAMHG